MFQARLRIVGGAAGRPEDFRAGGRVWGIRDSCYPLLGGWDAMEAKSEGLSRDRARDTGQGGLG